MLRKIVWLSESYAFVPECPSGLLYQLPCRMYWPRKPLGVEEFIALKNLFVCDSGFCTIYCFTSLVIVIVDCP